MRLMEINRRKFIQRSGLALTGAVGVTFLGCGGHHSLSQVSAKDITSVEKGSAAPLFAATRRDRQGTYSAALFTSSGDVRAVPLPERGHDVAVRPRFDGRGIEVVAFARRPGNFAVSFSISNDISPVQFFAQENRHFYGHGVFSPDGRLLYTTENDFENGVGVIGVRDATQNYKQIGELPSHGVGPHDMALLDDGMTLVIANGGLETSPDSGRQILNLHSMEPSLVYIDRRTGDLLEKQILSKELRQLSIRHLTVAGRNRVVFGCQFKGAATLLPELIGFHDRGAEVKMMSAPDEVQISMKNYVGSVSVDRSGEFIAASCPRGNLVTFWNANNMEFIGTKSLTDGCGISGTKKDREFLLTSGEGVLEVRSINSGHERDTQRRFPVNWDNHAELVE